MEGTHIRMALQATSAHADDWRSEPSPDDTLIRQAVRVHASRVLEFAGRMGRPNRSSANWTGTWMSDSREMANQVVVTQPLANPAQTVAEINSLIPAHVPYMVLSPWPIPDLRQHGLELWGQLPLMVRLPSSLCPTLDQSLEVVEAHDATGLAYATNVIAEGFHIPGTEQLAPQEVLAPSILQGPTRVWIAIADGTPIAAAAAHVHAGMQLVMYVATVPAARGRGAGTAVSWAATCGEPDLPAVLIASDQGRSMYERIGYVLVDRWTIWRRPPMRSADSP